MVRVNTERLIENCAKKIQGLTIAKPQIKVERAGVDIAKEEISARVIGSRADDLNQTKRAIDCIEFIRLALQ